MDAKVKKLIEKTFSIETGNGVHGRVERTKHIIGNLLGLVEGNVVEIGGGHGESAAIFLKEAVKYNRTFLEIDPWDGNGTGKGYTFENFSKSIDIMSKNISLCRCKSQEPQATIAILAIAPIAYAFADGDVFDEKSVLKDLLMLAFTGVKVICVDDHNRKEVNNALSDFLKEAPYKKIGKSEMHECYLLREE